VYGDSEQGAYDLTAHLLALGHRRIAMLSGPPAVTTAADRVAGYRRALVESGITPCDDLIAYGPYTLGSGFALAQQMMAQDDPPTAFFAANNFIAVGALRGLRELGLHVPNDVSL